MNCWEEFKEWYWECFSWNIILLLYSKHKNLSFLVTNSHSTEREVSSCEVLSLSLCDLFITPTHGSALNYFPLHFQEFATISNCSKSVGRQIVLLRFLTINNTIMARVWSLGFKIPDQQREFVFVSFNLWPSVCHSLQMHCAYCCNYNNCA